MNSKSSSGSMDAVHPSKLIELSESDGSELMRSLIVADSLWLDSYQSSVMVEQGLSSSSRVVEITDAIPGNSSSFDESRIIKSNPCASIVEMNPSLQRTLPAQEFISGSRSCVAQKSFSLMNRSLNDTR